MRIPARTLQVQSTGIESRVGIARNLEGLVKDILGLVKPSSDNAS